MAARNSAAGKVLSQERTPPHNPEVERAVLGALLRAAITGDIQTIDQTCARLRAESFYHSFHRNLYQAVQDLRGEGRIPDVIVCADWLKQRGLWDVTGRHDYLPAAGESYLSEVLRTEFSIGTLDDYLDLLLRDEAKRAVATLGGELWNASLNGYEAEGLVSLTERMLEGVKAINSTTKSVSSPLPAYELLQLERKPLDWLRRGFVPSPRDHPHRRRGWTLKTWIAFGLGIAIATGRSAFGALPVPRARPVLILEEEMQLRADGRPPPAAGPSGRRTALGGLRARLPL